MDREKLHQLFKRAKSCFAVPILLTADSTALVLSIITALMLRFEYLPWHKIYECYLRGHLSSLPLALAFYLGVFAAFRLYRCAWRFASLDILWGIICANTIGVVGLVSIQYIVDGYAFPRSVLVITWAGSIILTGAERVILRILSIASRYGIRSLQVIRREAPPKRTLILGAAVDGVSVLRALREDPDLNYNVVGFLDDDPSKIGLYIGGVRVLGPLADLKQVLTSHNIDTIIVALPEISDGQIRRDIVECRRNGVPVKVVPRISDVLTGKPIRLVDFSVEDLLKRTPSLTNIAEIGTYLTDKRVLVTGAGGSIGSELCRQIISLRPASLVLLGHGENSIHQIYRELQAGYQELADRIQYAIASVSNSSRINQVFEQHKPQVVFHAAAHKHVPMMESNEQEAVYNNVMGTHCVAEACGRWDVERVVLISTDKAADPCCVMGATKWLCEEIFRAMAHYWTGTAYIAVRFGNVLGSRGSVVPIFCEQIERGGPVTLTHPEMTRYFMTVTEAVRLVLQAGAVGKSDELYLLDMGKPVKIVELAKEIVRLNGLDPETDIEFEYTGIRPGEKLHEQLVSDMESIEPTRWKGLSVIHRPQYFTPAQMMDALRQLENVASHGSAAETRKVLDELLARRRSECESVSPAESWKQEDRLLAGAE